MAKQQKILLFSGIAFYFIYTYISDYFFPNASILIKTGIGVVLLFFASYFISNHLRKKESNDKNKNNTNKP